jgi:hypothetical protein
MVGEIILAYNEPARQRTGSFAPCRAVSRQRSFEARDQGFSVEWFAQEAGCSRLQGPIAIALDGKSRDENDRKAAPVGEQVGLQFKPAHGGHSDIRYDARRVVKTGRSQELFG